MKKINTAVIGAGHIGKFHAQKYASLPASQLVAVVDPEPSRAAAVVADLDDQVAALTDYRSLLGEVDAVSIAAPTSLHHQIAKDFLQQGTHLLIEKTHY